MEYLLLIYAEEARFETGYPEDELAEYKAFGDKHKPAIQSGKALHPTSEARTVRVRKGEVVAMDGPFAETKEQLGGFYLVTADTLDQAASMAAEIPSARYGSIEVRPIMKLS